VFRAMKRVSLGTTELLFHSAKKDAQDAIELQRPAHQSVSTQEREARSPETQ